MESLPYEIKPTSKKMTAYMGLSSLAEVMQRMRWNALIAKHLPNGGKKHNAIASADYINAMILNQHTGASCSGDMKRLVAERELLKLLGLSRIPDVSSWHKWLKRMANKSTYAGMREINRHLLTQGLRRTASVSVDIDATFIVKNSEHAFWSYLKERGYMPLIATIEESKSVLHVENRQGNVSPAYGHVAFLEACQQALPEGVRIGRLRADAASYQSDVINKCMYENILFCIRAKSCAELRQTIREIDGRKWKALMKRGQRVNNEEVCELIWVMKDTEPFRLIVQRRRDVRQQGVLFDITNEDESQFMNAHYVYRCIATNDNDSTPEEIVHLYNARGEESENRIKEFKSDFMGKLPSSDFDSNTLYLLVTTLSYNLFSLLKKLLPNKWERVRCKKILRNIYTVAGVITQHSRRCIIKISREYYDCFMEIHDHLRRTLVLINPSGAG